MFNDCYKNRPVLITGHTGFKGSWLTEWLLKLGAKVSGFSNGVPYSPCHFEQIDLESRCLHRAGDIRDLTSIKKTLNETQPEIVFHLAAQSLVRKSFDEPRLTFETNAMGTLNLLEAIRDTPSVKAVVLVTSDKCYLNRGWDFGYRESDTLGGEDPYSSSKACAELIAYSYIHSFFNEASSPWIATARAGNVIGGGDWASNRIVPDCVRAWMKNEAVILRNPGHTRPWQHVLEPLSGYLWLGTQLLARNNTVKNEAFNFGPQPRNNQTVAALVAEMRKTWLDGKFSLESFESGAPVNAVKTPKEAPLLQLNCDKAWQRLSWVPTLSYADGVRLTTEWYNASVRHGTSPQKLTAKHIETFEQTAIATGTPWAIQENCHLTSPRPIEDKNRRNEHLSALHDISITGAT